MKQEKQLTFLDNLLHVTNTPKGSTFVRAFYLKLSFQYPEPSDILIVLHIRFCNSVRLTTISKVIWTRSDQAGLKLCVCDLKVDALFNHKLGVPSWKYGHLSHRVVVRFECDYIFEHNSAWLLADN